MFQGSCIRPVLASESFRGLRFRISIGKHIMLVTSDFPQTLPKAATNELLAQLPSVQVGISYEAYGFLIRREKNCICWVGFKVSRYYDRYSVPRSYAPQVFLWLVRGCCATSKYFPNFYLHAQVTPQLLSWIPKYFYGCSRGLVLRKAAFPEIIPLIICE